ncbi:MAG: type I methionyl aminopeptidase [Anaerolineae bacterium]|nr:type I methionyl aminopeptidase [Anaerolineae bacterium]MCX8067617.1 type I methionyl aminopeptidase [Anaerolineae bacterium]MDW7991890.1 type I methionyl aminopeptidase [Anaerolineae bacterium]
MIHLKTPAEIEKMRQAGRIVAEVLQRMREWVAPGVTTGELNRRAEELIRQRGGIPSFKGYPPGSRHPFPAVICTSVNEELVHGIPGPRVLKEGDIISIDVGVIYDGYHGDAGITLPVGEISPEARRLLEVTEAALYAGIAQARAGNRVGDISAAIQRTAESAGYSVVREYTGHGIGRRMHEEPQVPNWGEPGQGPLLRAGMTLAIEAMVLQGAPQVRTLEDHWTVVSVDGKLTAYFEHTVLVRDGEPEILTQL